MLLRSNFSSFPQYFLHVVRFSCLGREHIFTSWLSWMRRPTGDDRDRQHSVVEIDYEIFSTVILSLPLIQEEQLSVSGERMCTILINCVED